MNGPVKFFTAEDMENFRRGVDDDNPRAWDRFKAKCDRVTGIDRAKLRPIGPAGW